MANFDDLVDDSHLQAQQSASLPQSQGNQVIPQQGNIAGQLPAFDDLQDDSEKYGSIGQQAIAGVEGLSRGIAGPLATAAEKHLLKVPQEDIRGRQEANPITAGIGEAAGLGAGLMTGTGEAAVMTKVGEAALEAANLAKLGEGASLGMKVGASAVQQAAEMAVLSAGDETSKMILQDPEASAESAISNVGMAAALGAAGGAFITGAVSPLWKATAAPKVESMLNGLKDHLNGTAAILPDQVQNAVNTLGIEVAPEMRAVLSGNPGAIEKFNVLKETQNKAILDNIDKIRRDASDSVMNSLGVTPEAVAVHSENEAGHDLYDTFAKEYKEKYQPIAEKLERRDAEASGITIPDEARLKAYGKLIEKGMEKVGTDSEYYKLYNDYGQRLLAKEDIGAVDKLKTEINKKIKGLRMGGDYNVIDALQDIKTTLGDFQESQIARKAMETEALGVKGAKGAGSQLLNERAETNRLYKEFAGMSDELTNHLGVGDFKGYGTLNNKLTDKITPEQLLNKFSIRNSADKIGFLEKNFPETLKKVQENELKRFLKPAILSAKEGDAISIRKLQDLIDKGMAGKSEYIRSIIPEAAINRVSAAHQIEAAIPNPKSSGTAGWLTKVTKHMPASALAAVAMLTSHNPVFGYLLGEMGQHMGRNIPDAINLGYLKFLGSNQPIKAEGFKAMVDFFHNTYKGDNRINEGIKNIFKAGAQVLISSNMPSKADTEKLDKIVSNMQKAPGELFAEDQGHVGHYLPDHQGQLAQVSARAVQYLQSIKPQPYKGNPLDKPIDPSKAEMSRYNRALEIAEQPAIMLKHIKEGTLQASDLQDLGAMYPGLYRTMAAKLSNEMISSQSEDHLIPYKTRMGLSLFLGQPLDHSMEPLSIMASQATYMPKAKPGQPQEGQKPKGNMDKLGKNDKSYMTPLQAAENHQASRRKS